MGEITLDLVEVLMWLLLLGARQTLSEVTNLVGVLTTGGGCWKFCRVDSIGGGLLFFFLSSDVYSSPLQICVGVWSFVLFARMTLQLY